MPASEGSTKGGRGVPQGVVEEVSAVWVVLELLMLLLSLVLRMLPFVILYLGLKYCFYA